MIYDPQYVSRFYDSYSNLEWDRLEKSAYGRLQSLMHTEMLGRYCHKGYRVLDAGCGPGRFSIEAAKLGARVTAFDISPGQLRIAREKIVEAGFIDSMDAFVQGDVSNMNQFNDGDFDLVLAFGGALSYVRELRYQAANELVRVVKSGGMLLVSVMSRIGFHSMWPGWPIRRCSMRHPSTIGT